MGVDFPDAGREWLSRFRAVCSIYTTYWIILMTAAVYGPLLVLNLTQWALTGLTLTWVLTTVAGIFAGKSHRNGKEKEGKSVTERNKEGNANIPWLSVVAKAAPVVFIIGLILLIATVEHVLLSHRPGSTLSLKTLADPQNYWKALEPWPMWFDKPIASHWSRLLDLHWLLHQSWPHLGLVIDKPGLLFIVLGMSAVILAWRVDINEFSMHHFYKNRLVRCYLGASRDVRKPNPFTGFDGGDDFPLSELRAIPAKQGGTRPGHPAANAPEPYVGPYPIVNTTLNLSAGKQLAWQERKGASFIFTPCYCGFDVAGWANTTGDTEETARLTPRRKLRDLRPFGFRSTEKYAQAGGPYFGTSISI